MMLGQYMAEIVQIYSGLKENIIEKLQDIKDKGYKKTCLFLEHLLPVRWYCHV